MCVAMCDLAREGSPRAEMTLPKARRPLLMEIPSLIRSPAAAVRLSFMKHAESNLMNGERKGTNPFGTSKIDKMKF
jgi:hypothetical protein